jgi:hypothetical protein
MKELIVKRGRLRTIFAGIILLLIAMLFALFAFSMNSGHRSYWKIQLLFPIVFYLICVGFVHFLIALIELNKGYLFKIDDFGIDHYLLGQTNWKQIQSLGINNLSMNTALKKTQIKQFSYLVSSDAVAHLNSLVTWGLRLFFSLRRIGSDYEMIVNLAGTGHTPDGLSNWVNKNINRLNVLPEHSTHSNIKF